MEIQNGSILKKTARKTWQVHAPQNVSWNSVHLLRYHLAEEGCKESQVSIAKNLLSDSARGNDYESAEVAVYWLLRAAVEEHEEARELLDECYKGGIGITDKNREKIEKCLGRSHDEKAANRVGNKLFSSVAGYLCSEAIPLRYFKMRVERLKIKGCCDVQEHLNEQLQEEFPEFVKGMDTINEAKSVTKSNVIECTLKCLRAENPTIDLHNATDSLPPSYFISKVIKLLRNLLETAFENFKEETETSLFPSTFLLSLSFLFILNEFVGVYHFNSSKQVANVFFALGILAFLGMISATSIILKLNSGFCNLNEWLQTLLIIEPLLPANDIVAKYERKKILPFIWFVFCLMIFITLIPYSMNVFVTTNVLFLCAGALCTIMVICNEQSELSYTSSFYIKTSYAVHVIFSLFNLGYWKRLTIGWCDYFEFVPYMKLGLHLNIHLNIFRLLSGIFLILLYISLGKSGNYKGFLHILVPHLITVAWFSVTKFVMLENDLELHHGTLGLLSCFVILMLTTITGIFWKFVTVGIVICTLFMTSFSFHTSTFIILAVLYKPSKFILMGLNRSSKYRKKYSFLIFLIITMVSALITHNHIVPTSGVVLPWDDYIHVCHQPAWDITNMAEVEIGCSQFEGVKITGEGIVNFVNVARKVNRVKTLVSLLPKCVANYVECFIGNHYVCDEATFAPMEFDRCQVFASRNISWCGLEKWTSYQFQVTLKMSSVRMFTELILEVDNHCKDFIVNLRRGHVLSVSGILRTNVGKRKPHLWLYSASCTNCQKELSCSEIMSGIHAQWNKSFELLIAFFTFPVVSYVK
ncbi:wolframin ER transmembrane glycoprotein wfs1 [Tachypleus tridentatus]|uniref:wolframin ER transmembrane glycoprotein wfs1 n=1 Tax=Tachypleus tridentatus TaxID=6853 RepID=UPI003FD625D2